MICKLTEEQILDIRTRVGQTQKEIAEEFGVDHTTIYKIIHRKRWTHI
jgi:transcriptional regulator with XRE-family HTH domain